MTGRFWKGFAIMLVLSMLVGCMAGPMPSPAQQQVQVADAKLVENLEAFIANINKMKPAASKGTYIKKCTIAACMSPGVQVAV